MRMQKIRAAIVATVIAVAGTVGVVGCSSDAGTDSPKGAGTDASSSEVQDEPQDDASDVVEDLETAREAVIEAMEYGTWTQVMLAPDVDGPTQKYGLLVMPFIKTDAASRVTGTVTLDGDNFRIEADSAATGRTWQIDQDGNITEVTD